jgi:hypothetical protein
LETTINDELGFVFVCVGERGVPSNIVGVGAIVVVVVVVFVVVVVVVVVNKTSFLLFLKHKKNETKC